MTVHEAIPIITVTPAMAERWLDVNPINRAVNPNTVARYTRAMKEGRWRMIGDPIRIARDGSLLDGQHRLEAVVKYGRGVRFAVLEGLELEDQRVMDSGQVRKTGQQMRMDGWAHASTVAAVARLLLVWNNGQVLQENKAQFGTDEIMDFAERYRDRMTVAVDYAHRVTMTVPINKAAVGATCWKAFHLAAQAPERLSTVDVHRFFTDLETGSGLGADSPVLLLRNSAQRWKNNRLRKTRLEHLVLLVRTWNAYRQGETLAKLQLPVEITTDHLIVL